MKWKSKSRIHGDSIEKYVATNVACLYCESILCTMNTNCPSIDLKCMNCNKFYQVKGKKVNKYTEKETFKHLGASYETTIKNIDLNIDYIFVYYDSDYKIMKLNHVKSENIEIVKRKQLSDKARRAGWIGCYIMYSIYQEVDTRKLSATSLFSYS